MCCPPGRSSLATDCASLIRAHSYAEHHSVQRTTALMLGTTRGSYEPATGCARRFRFEPTEREPSSGSRLHRVCPAGHQPRPCSATKGAMRWELTAPRGRPVADNGSHASDLSDAYLREHKGGSGPARGKSCAPRQKQGGLDLIPSGALPIPATAPTFGFKLILQRHLG
jgi:hypothetical protein